MKILEYLLENSESQETLVPTPLQKIMEELDHMTIKEAKYILLFAHLLGCVANVDEKLSPEEREAMIKIIDNFANVSHQLSEMIVELTKWNFLIFGKGKNEKHIQGFKKISDPNQREGIIHCLLAVAESDHKISENEFVEIQSIGRGLGIEESHLQNLFREYHIH